MVTLEKASKIYEEVSSELEDIKYYLTLNPEKNRTDEIQKKLKKVISKLNGAK